jgi:hypothetical protein
VEEVKVEEAEEVQEDVVWSETDRVSLRTALRASCQAVIVILWIMLSTHCTALHCTALHCTALHCTALHYTAPPCTALQCTELQCTALHCTAPPCTALHCTALQLM